MNEEKEKLSQDEVLRIYSTTAAVKSRMISDFEVCGE